MAGAPASIRQVAAYAGVSLGTVSNVLNRPDIVAEPTRSRVRDAIEQLGFIRNESARQLRAGRSRTIGLVVLDVANPFFMIETPALNVAAGQRAGAAIAELPAARRPSAVFCANDLLALGVLQEMTAQRIRVPDSISLIGCDDIDVAAAQLLLDEALGEGSHQHRQVVFEPELVVRESSRAKSRTARRPRRPAPADRAALTSPAVPNQAR